MKAIFIAFDQAHYERIGGILTKNGVNGYTYHEQVMGQGSRGGEPHFGSHAWPSMNSSIITVVDDEKVRPVLDQLRALDQERPLLGLRAFVWNVEDSI